MQPSCETLQQKHEELKDLARAYRAALVQEGMMSEAFKDAGRRFEEAKEETSLVIEETNLAILKERFPIHITIHREFHAVSKYREALEKRGYKVVFKDGISLLDEVKITREDKMNLTLVKVTGTDLGLSGPYSAEEALEKAKDLGLEPCPQWAALQYRLKSPRYEYASIGMNPITTTDRRGRDVHSIFDIKPGIDGAPSLSSTFFTEFNGTSDQTWIFCLKDTRRRTSKVKKRKRRRRK